jgi:hypothetical protein
MKSVLALAQGRHAAVALTAFVLLTANARLSARQTGFGGKLLGHLAAFAGAAIALYAGWVALPALVGTHRVLTATLAKKKFGRAALSGAILTLAAVAGMKAVEPILANPFRAAVPAGSRVLAVFAFACFALTILSDRAAGKPVKFIAKEAKLHRDGTVYQVDKRESFTPAQKHETALRDGNWCAWCGTPPSHAVALQGDHVTARSKGGETEVHNCQLLCGPDNLLKLDNSDEVGRELFRKKHGYEAGSRNPDKVNPSLARQLNREARKAA